MEGPQKKYLHAFVTDKSTPADAKTAAAPNQEEEEDDCPFCVFMKAGPCGQAFKDWEKCVDEAHKGEQDIVAKCTGPTRALKECMEANTEYYAPVLETDDTKEALDAEKGERSEAEGGKSKEDARKAEVRGFANRISFRSPSGW